MLTMIMHLLQTTDNIFNSKHLAHNIRTIEGPGGLNLKQNRNGFMKTQQMADVTGYGPV